MNFCCHQNSFREKCLFSFEVTVFTHLRSNLANLIKRKHTAMFELNMGNLKVTFKRLNYTSVLKIKRNIKLELPKIHILEGTYYN